MGSQGCQFSDFSLISAFFELTSVKIIFLILSLEHFSHKLMIDSDYQKKLCVLFQTFSLNLTYIHGSSDMRHETWTSK